VIEGGEIPLIAGTADDITGAIAHAAVAAGTSPASWLPRARSSPAGTIQVQGDSTGSQSSRQPRGLGGESEVIAAGQARG
jgi:hypothetical protein